jgi:hypothetical protein
MVRRHYQAMTGEDIEDFVCAAVRQLSEFCETVNSYQVLRVICVQ